MDAFRKLPQLLKRPFCRHIMVESLVTARSERSGNDNLIIETHYHECSKCGKEEYTQEVVEVEKDWYLLNK